jgi:hypothetical protein
MPRHPIGEKPMTGKERQRRWRERLRKETPALTDRQKLIASKKEINRLEAQIVRERGIHWARAARLAWVEDHPGHTAADFELWGSCGATREQGRHWLEWDRRFSARYHAELQATPDSIGSVCGTLYRPPTTITAD